VTQRPDVGKRGMNVIRTVGKLVSDIRCLFMLSLNRNYLCPVVADTQLGHENFPFY
jgi:hypothetical protein